MQVWRDIVSVLRILGSGVQGMGWYKCLVGVRVFKFVRGCCKLEGGISVGDGRGWGVMSRVVFVIVGW